MLKFTTTHCAFSDDSKHESDRYNSLALVTLEVKNFLSFNEELKKILEDSDISDEFKWNKVRNAKYRFAAEKLIDIVFKNKIHMRVDVLIWDLEDNRHKNLPGRDDSENLVRMYYHLLSTTLSKRWPISNTTWQWYPDEQSSVDWNMLQDCISNKRHKCVADLFGQNPSFEQVSIQHIQPSNSKYYFFIQLADLFAGMGAYSYGNFDQYKKWEQQKNSQLSLFEDRNKRLVEFTNSKQERFRVIEKFNKMCKSNAMQIALESSRGFKSYIPSNFINFWLYEPQHEYDRAPQKINKM